MISISNLNFFYGKSQALFDINIGINERLVTAFIGPSGCGKSTFLRTLNRMNDVIKRLAVVATIFLPLSFLAGFFGMNFQTIPYENTTLFVLSLALFFGLPATMAWWFYRKRWF